MPAIEPQHDAVVRLCRGNADAVALIENVWLLACVYDDAIDGDKKRTDDEIHRAFAFAMFGLQANPAYCANPGLQLVLLQSIACWRAANALEKSDSPDAVHSAYVLRCSPYQFFVAVVLTVAGMDAAVEAAEFFYGSRTGDSLDDYVAEHMKGA